MESVAIAKYQISTRSPARPSNLSVGPADEHTTQRCAFKLLYIYFDYVLVLNHQQQTVGGLSVGVNNAKLRLIPIARVDALQKTLTAVQTTRVTALQHAPMRQKFEQCSLSSASTRVNSRRRAQCECGIRLPCIRTRRQNASARVDVRRRAVCVNEPLFCKNFS